LDVTSYEIYNSSGQQLSDNQTNSTGGVTTWNYSINPSTWSEISHKVVVFANDTNGQSNQENFTYIIDDTTPSVSGAAFSDADNIVRHADSITLNVTITDTNTIASVLVANDSSISMSVLSGNIYYVTTNATELGCSNTDGDCTVTFTATDSAGNVNNSHTYTFTIDDIYPSVTGAVMAGGLINLTDNIVRENDTIEVNITVSDTNNITSVTVNGQSMNNITATTYNYTGTALSLCGASEGACTLQFNATDISGNLNSSTTLAMTVDDTVSTVNLVSLSEDYVQNNTVVVVTVNVSDTHSSVYNVTAEGYSLTNQGVDVWNASINLTSGNNVVDVVVYDIVGNQQTDNSTSFTIDDVSPVIHSATLEDDYTQNGTLVLLTVNVTDNSISTVTAEGISLTRSQSFQDLWTGNVTLFSGDLVINVSATDNASNTAVNESTTYTIDDTSPGINSVSLADNYVRTGQIVQITVNVTDGYTYSVTANISGTTSSLVNTTTDTWIGNLTIPSSSGLVEIVAVDGADNSNTTNSTTFTVDDTSPSFSIIVPASSGLYTNDDGNITFNFTVSDASLAKVNVSIDNATYKNGSAVNGTHIWLFTDLRAGLHTAVFTAMDNADNNATSVSRSFHMIRPLNVSEAIDDLETGLGSAVTGFNISNSAGDISSNESADINTTLTIEMNLNLSGTNVSVTIPDFDGLDVNWEQTFTVVTNESSVKALTATSRAGSNISAIVLFENMGYFLAEEEFGMAEITFDVVLADLDVLYIADDIGETIYKLSACSSTPTSVANVAAACYTNTSANVTMYLPHFSGGALANDTQAPDINITYPANNTEVNNSYFNLTFYAYEANPNTDSFCTYVFNGSIYDNDIDTSDMSQTGTRYDFNSELTQFADGDYNLSVNCTDLNNRTSTQIYAVSINDSVNPAISSSGPSGAQSTTSTSLSVTLTATTDEKSICKYDSANVSYASMDDFLGSNTTYALTHETSISYSGDDSSESYYVRCADLNGEVSDSTLISYSVDVGSADDGSGAGAGDGTGTSVTTYTKSWLEIAAGSTRISSIDQSVYDGVPFTQIEFEALNDMTNVEVQVRALTSAPSSTGTITYNAYSYLQIVESFGEDDITNTKIQFKVPKVWLATESISNDNVALFRYNDDVWEEQETTITSEDSDNVYYEAVTTGFSYFAIGQLVEEVVEEETEEVVETEEEEEVVEEEITGDVVEDLEEEELVEKQSKVWIWILLLVVIALGGFTFWFVKQKPKGSIKHYELKTHEVHRVDGGVDKLETFVKTYLDKGYSEEQIRRSLKNVGWSDMMIDDVFKRMK
jgi:PGF-pre-PGF domain-containing protein